MPKRRKDRMSVVQPLDESYKLIPLTQGQVAMVDAEDYESLMDWNWHAYWNKCTKSFYAQRSDSKLWMHRMILKCGKGEEGDHINHDSLDNRKENLRKASRSQNACNMRISVNTSGFRGVSWSKSNKKWQAQIKIHQRPIHLRFYEAKEDAARAYDNAAIIHHGDFATLNFTK